jgi:hypothetical protein
LRRDLCRTFNHIEKENDMSKQSKQYRIDTADEAFHSVASDLGEALDIARSMESEGQVIGAYGRAVIIARRLIAADKKLHALSNAGYENAAIRNDQRLADTLRGAADGIVRRFGNDPKVIKLRVLVEELVQLELPGASSI